MKRWWYYPPLHYNEWRLVSRGSDEFNRCTWVIGTPLSGHLVIPRRQPMCMHYDRRAQMGYVALPNSDGGCSIRTEQVAPGVNVDFNRETGQVIGVEVFAQPTDHSPRSADSLPG